MAYKKVLKGISIIEKTIRFVFYHIDEYKEIMEMIDKGTEFRHILFEIKQLNIHYLHNSLITRDRYVENGHQIDLAEEELKKIGAYYSSLKDIARNKDDPSNLLYTRRHLRRK